MDGEASLIHGRALESIVLMLGALVFLLGLMFGIFNVVRFRRHRTYSLSLFYAVATVTLVLRLSYCIYCLLGEDFITVLWLVMLPNYFTSSVVVCQMNTYILLMLRLQLYVDERDMKVEQAKISAKNVFILEKTS